MTPVCLLAINDVNIGPEASVTQHLVEERHEQGLAANLDGILVGVQLLLEGCQLRLVVLRNVPHRPLQFDDLVQPGVSGLAEARNDVSTSPHTCGSQEVEQVLHHELRRMGVLPQHSPALMIQLARQQHT